MLKTLKYFFGFKIKAEDEDIGWINDLYFDQRMWAIRYLLVDTSYWLPDRLVLISPTTVQAMDWSSKSLVLNITKDQVAKSPSIIENLPVYRQNEIDLMQHYGWSDYWQPLGVNISESEVLLTKKMTLNKEQKETENNPYLRSAYELFDYQIIANLEKAGHVIDYIIEEESWIIRYFIIKTNFLGSKMMLSPAWIDAINWSDKAIRVSITKRLIKTAPKFKYNKNLTRTLESNLYDYFARPKYWEAEEAESVLQ